MLGNLTTETTGVGICEKRRQISGGLFFTVSASYWEDPTTSVPDTTGLQKANTGENVRRLQTRAPL